MLAGETSTLLAAVGPLQVASNSGQPPGLPEKSGNTVPVVGATLKPLPSSADIKCGVSSTTRADG